MEFLKSLDTVPDKKVVDTIIELMNSLHWLEDQKALEPLIEPLLKGLVSQDKRQRGIATKLVGMIKKRDVKELTKALKDKEWSMRHGAALALGVVRDERSVDALVKAYHKTIMANVSDSDDMLTLRSTIVKALSNIDSVEAKRIVDAEHEHRKKSIEQLVANLESDPKVSLLAAGALDRIGWRPHSSKMEVAYWIAKRDWDQCVKMGAKAVEPLIAYFKRYGEPEALATLGRIGDRRAVGLLITVLDHWNHILRIPAIRALGQIGDKRAVQPLTAILDIPRPRTDFYDMPNVITVEDQLRMAAEEALEAIDHKLKREK